MAEIYGSINTLADRPGSRIGHGALNVSKLWFGHVRQELLRSAGKSEKRGDPMRHNIACSKRKDAERKNGLLLTRRTVLQRTGWVLAAAAFPSVAARPLFGIPAKATPQTRADY